MRSCSPCLIAVIAALPALSSAFAQPRILEMSSERFIEVGGEASVEVAPDLARLTLGVTSTGKDANAAMAANANAVNAVIAALKAQGVAAGDIQTSSLSISPQFSNPASPSAREQTITGYVVTDMVSLTARDLSRLGALLDGAVHAGANAVYGLTYGETNPGALIDRVRPLAVADARRKAEIYAAAGGAGVGRLMTLTEQNAPSPTQFRRSVYAPSAAAATPIEAGQERLTVTIIAQFELTQ